MYTPESESERARDMQKKKGGERGGREREQSKKGRAQFNEKKEYVRGTK